MAEKANKIPFHVEMNRIIDLLAKQIYQSPFALLRRTRKTPTTRRCSDERSTRLSSR